MHAQLDKRCSFKDLGSSYGQLELIVSDLHKLWSILLPQQIKADALGISQMRNWRLFCSENTVKYLNFCEFSEADGEGVAFPTFNLGSILQKFFQISFSGYEKVLRARMVGVEAFADHRKPSCVFLVCCLTILCRLYSTIFQQA